MTLRNIILFNIISLDGFFAGPDGDIYWHQVDEEFNEFSIEQLNEAGGLIFGRVTYELMAAYWPTPSAAQDDPVVAGMMNTLPKIVVSRTLETVGWNNTRLIKEDVFTEIAALKQQPGRDLFIFGSANLAAGLTLYGLIDEYRLMVNPVILGSGTPLFKDIHKRLRLKRIKTRNFQNGNVLLIYQPAEKEA